MLDKSYYDKTDEILEHYGRKASSLIPIMQDIQAEYNYLSEAALTLVAEKLGVSAQSVSRWETGGSLS